MFLGLEKPGRNFAKGDENENKLEKIVANPDVAFANHGNQPKGSFPFSTLTNLVLKYFSIYTLNLTCCDITNFTDPVD